MNGALQGPAGAGRVHPYEGARAVIATRHAKERVIAPPLADRFGLVTVPAEGLDTDSLGTFTGEIARHGTMLEVAVAKARLGMAAAGLPIGIASEGTFGPHPGLPFVPAGLELLVIVDDRIGLVLHESLVAPRTNFGRCVMPGGDVDRFLRDVGFPTHGLIVRRGGDGPAVAKGITDRAALDAAVAAAVAEAGSAGIETDMRACFNPTRMATIGTLAGRLADRLARLCPACGTPGFGRVGALDGLPCEDCHQPTSMVRAEIHGCARCGLRIEKQRADGLRCAPSRLCSSCNP
jgi:hypothetical protein